MRSLPRDAFASSSRMRSISASGSGRESSVMARLQPLGAAEQPPHEGASHSDDDQRRRIAPRQLQFWHVLEIHSPDAGERRRYGEDAGPGGQPLGDFGF